MPKNKGVAMPSVERYRSSAIGPILPTAFRPDLVSTMICTEKQCHYISKARLWQVKSGIAAPAPAELLPALPYGGKHRPPSRKNTLLHGIAC